MQYLERDEIEVYGKLILTSTEQLLGSQDCPRPWRQGNGIQGYHNTCHQVDIQLFLTQRGRPVLCGIVHNDNNPLISFFTFEGINIPFVILYKRSE
jgi:hypothetical protein